jgi:hypothetical protein
MTSNLTIAIALTTLSIFGSLLVYSIFSYQIAQAQTPNYVFIKSKLNGFVLSLGPRANPAAKCIPVQMFPPKGLNNVDQLWAITPDGIQNKLNGYILTTNGGQTSPGTRIIACAPSPPGQKYPASDWIMTNAVNPSTTWGFIQSKDNTGVVLDIAGANNLPGAKVQLWTKNTCPCQSWKTSTPTSVNNAVQSANSKTFDMGYVGSDQFDPSGKCFLGSCAIGGPMMLVVNKNGDYTFTSTSNSNNCCTSWHDSGSANYRLNLGIRLTTPSGIGYDFLTSGNVDGHCLGLGMFSSICGSEGPHDYSWRITGNNPSIAENWAEVYNAKAVPYAEIQDSLQRTAGQLVDKAIDYAKKEGVKYLVSAVATAACSGNVACGAVVYAAWSAAQANS